MKRFPNQILFLLCVAGAGWFAGCGSNPSPTSPTPSSSGPTDGYLFSSAFRVPRIAGTNANTTGVASGNGVIYVVDYNDHAIEVFNPNGQAITFLGASSLSQPLGLAYDGASGTLFVADAIKGVVELDQNGIAVTTISTGAITSPNNIALDSSGNFWVEGGTGTAYMVEKCSNALGCGAVTLNISQINAADVPFGLTLDHSGHVWLGDNNNSKVEKFDASTGNYISSFGGPVTGSGPSTLTTAQFSSLADCKADSSGNLIVIDGNMPVAKLFTPDGTFIENFTNSDQISGIKEANYLYVDPGNNVYVTDFLTPYVSVFHRQ